MLGRDTLKYTISAETTNGFRSVSINPQYIALADGYAVKILDTSTGNELHNFQPFGGETVYSVEMDGDYLIANAQDTDAKVYDIPNINKPDGLYTLTQSYRGKNAEIDITQFRVLTTDSNANAHVYNVSDGSKIKSQSIPDPGIGPPSGSLQRGDENDIIISYGNQEAYEYSIYSYGKSQEDTFTDPTESVEAIDYNTNDEKAIATGNIIFKYNSSNNLDWQAVYGTQPNNTVITEGYTAVAKPQDDVTVYHNSTGTVVTSYTDGNVAVDVDAVDKAKP